MLTAIAFMLINGTSYVMALTRGPFWGLLAYANIYFNAPIESINWWAYYLPFTRWSLLTSAVLLISLVLHWGKTSEQPLGSAKWAFAFFFVSLVVTTTLAVNPENAGPLQYTLFTYCLIIFIMIKSISEEKQLRWFLVANIALAANLSLNAHLYGRRIHGRLEGIGATDAFGANEFGLLLAAILPFIVVFLVNGKKNERILCFLATPFVLNAFILANSRGAAVAFVLAIALSTLVFGDRKIRRGIVGIAILAIPVMIWLTDEAYIERFSTLIGAGDSYQSEEDINELSSGRIDIWTYGMEMVADYPLGAGPDGFKDLSQFYLPPELLVHKEGFDYGRRAAHNTYLQVIVEQGTIGLIIFLMMCISVCLALRRSFKSVKRASDIDPFWRNMIFATAVSFLTTLAGGLVTNRVFYEFFWWQIAIAVVVTTMANTAVTTAAKDDSTDATPIPT